MSCLAGCPPEDREAALHDSAQAWVRLALEATRAETQGPTIEARKLWHLSAAMYDAWAAYDPIASGYFTGTRLKSEAPEATIENIAETLHHAVYPVLREGFRHLAEAPPGTEHYRAYAAFRAKMRAGGYIDVTGAPVPSPAQALGARIAEAALRFCEGDGANEPGGYADTSGYIPANPTLHMDLPEADGVSVHRWQPIQMPDGAVQDFLTPHWRFVTPFSLPPYREGIPHVSPGGPDGYGTQSENIFINENLELVIISASLDPERGRGRDLIDISPNARGNNPWLHGVDPGHDLNPATGQPYTPQFVQRGDFYRALAAFLDGNRFNMPGPWWFELASDILSGTGTVDRRPANKLVPHDLAYDVKLYFTLGGALHDTAIAVWDVKRRYDTARPVTTIRWLGQRNLLPLHPNVVEEIAPGDPLAGAEGENVGRQKIQGWLGPYAGTGWMLPEDWRPYQDPDFITPPFPGYVSGHAAFGWAFKEVMESYTDDAFVPGGLLAWAVDELPFDRPLSAPLRLEWATYRDIADDAGLGRRMCGVHPSTDTSAGGGIGQWCGWTALTEAEAHFQGQREGVVPE